MRFLQPFFGLSLFFLLYSNSFYAQTLAQWTFENVPTVTTLPTNATASDGVWATNLTATYYAGNGGGNAIGARGFTSALVTTQGYLEFALTPNPNFKFNLTDITFDEQRSSTGPATWALRSSLNGFAADIATGATATAFANKLITLNSSFLNVQSGITFRIYGYAGSSTAGTWRIDNLTIIGATIPSTGPYLIPTKSAITLANTPEGTPSVSESFSISGASLTADISLTAPIGFEISLSANAGFSQNLMLTQTGGTLDATTIYVRQTGATAGTFSANLTCQSGALTQNIALSGITNSTGADGTFAQPTTLDVAAWNVEWFGHPTEGPTNNDRQKDNVTLVMQTLKADIFQVSEVSDASLFAQVVNNLVGYSHVCSEETSYSITDPDPMSQKLCFVYKTAMFANIQTNSPLRALKYDPNLVTNYPDLQSRFWASGRLPFMLTADVTIGATTKKVAFVGVHARANSSSDDPIGRYNMRKYDVERLKDTLDGLYGGMPIIMLGDFNDDLDFTVVSGIAGGVTSYINYKNDAARFSMTTLPLSLAGQRSTVGFNSVIDHLIVSNEVTGGYVANSARLGTPTNYIASYGSSTTDHYPVMASFDLAGISDPIIPVELVYFKGKEESKTAILLNWETASERNVARFLIERSVDAKNFEFIGEVKATGGTTQTPQYYSFRDEQLSAPIYYYRLKQVDLDGKFQTFNTVTIKRQSPNAYLRIYPNPVKEIINWTTSNTEGVLFAKLFDANGRLVRTESGVSQMSVVDLPNGFYFLELAKKDGQVFREKVLIVK